jgi:cation diffusion facilitator family transporter
MDHCREDTSGDITAMQERHGRVLWVVLLINAVMFLVEGGAGVMAHSTALLADALDMLGDTLVYGLSLFVLARSARWQAGAAQAKGGCMLAFGLGVLGEAVLKAFHPVMPGVETMGVMGGLALAANLVCFVLLYRSRGDHLNMRSTGFCSRNDVMANGGGLLAAAGSDVWTSRWPDLLVGAVIASLFLSSALHVLQQSMQALRAPLATVQHPVEQMTLEAASRQAFTDAVGSATHARNGGLAHAEAHVRV